MIKKTVETLYNVDDVLFHIDTGTLETVEEIKYAELDETTATPMYMMTGWKNYQTQEQLVKRYMREVKDE